jgi:UDP-hydrolysing UDP-N-acetyl-D-glucosamine 2-epimerase
MKVLALTSIRSEYDLMSPLYSLLRDDPEIDFRLLVGGAHMSHSFGYGRQYIEDDGYEVLLDIESLVDSDSASSRLKSAANLLIGSIDIVRKFSPDLILYAGDREEVMIGALLGGYLSIPSVHFYGGDHATDGHIDNPIRHAVSKLSTSHFVIHDEHRKRLLAIGEPESRIFNIGSIALDKFVLENSVEGAEVVKKLAGIHSDIPCALVIYHPIDDESGMSDVIIGNIIESLASRGFFCFVGMPNTDPGNQKIVRKLNELNSDNEKIYLFSSLSRENFVALFKHVNLIVGNSSAGLLESASIPIPAVNVGMRQRGRLCGENVIFVGVERREIQGGIDRAISSDFREGISDMNNPYGSGHSALKAYSLIKETDFRSRLKKTEDPLNEMSKICEK